jgi:hypothetical protein
MKNPFALFLLAALASSPCAREPDVVVTMNSYGPIQTGMPIAEVRRVLARLGRKNLPDTSRIARTGCDHYHASPELQFMVDEGKIVRMETREKHVVTPSGTRIGTPVEKARQVLGSRIEETQQHYSEDVNDRAMVLTSGNGQFAIRIEANQAVAEIYVGAQDAIRYVEGCA